MRKIDSFRGKYYFLSNFYNAPVMYEGVMYKNNEAAFQSVKIADIAKRSSFSELDPSSAKRKGRRVRLRNDWESIKDKVMEDIVRDKFTRNESLKQRLIATGDTELIEGNTWGDNYWGVCEGRGRNKLGKILMKVREGLKCGN